MKIHLTKKEYRLLLDILSIADWVMNAHKTKDDPQTAPYRKLEQKFMSYAKDFGYEDLIVYTKKFEMFFPTREYEDQETDRKFIDEYEEEVFWEELVRRMAQRDQAKEKGHGKLMEMPFMDQMNDEYKIAEKYNREFMENGLKNLIINKESRENRKDPILDDHEKLEIKTKMEQVNEIFRKHPNEYIAEMEELGFKYFDDGVEFEELEEKNARPENQRQKGLVDFFEGRKELSEKIFESFSTEKASDNPNYPLIRKYFKEGNQNLKALLLYGLNNYAGRLDLLSDLAFFHEYGNILTTLIDYYTNACKEQANLETFTELARDFYYSTSSDGYEALYALQELFEPGTEKRIIIDFLIAEEDGVDSQSMDSGTSRKH